jgi:hypothetical protein
MISQKVSRLSNLFKQDRKPNNESIQDSILDLIGYSFLLDAITEEQESKPKTLNGLSKEEALKWLKDLEGGFSTKLEETNL